MQDRNNIMTAKTKIIIFCILTVLVMMLVAWEGQEHTAVARSFLRNVFRHIF